MKLVMVPWFFNIIPDAADGAGLFTHKNCRVLGANVVKYTRLIEHLGMYFTVENA